MFDFISTSADLINNGVINLLVAGYTKSLVKVHNMELLGIWKCKSK